MDKRGESGMGATRSGTAVRHDAYCTVAADDPRAPPAIATVHFKRPHPLSMMDWTFNRHSNFTKNACCFAKSLKKGQKAHRTA